METNPCQCGPRTRVDFVRREGLKVGLIKKYQPPLHYQRTYNSLPPSKSHTFRMVERAEVQPANQFRKTQFKFDLSQNSNSKLCKIISNVMDYFKGTLFQVYPKKV